MKRFLVTALAFVVASGLAAVPARAQRGGGGGAPGGGAQGGRGAAAPDPVEKIQQIKPNFYWVAGGGANSVVLVTPEGIILADTKNPGDEIANALAEQIKSVSPLPVKYIFNTHHHPDHVGNNGKFVATGAQVIGLEKMANLMATDARTKDIPGRPTITFAKDYTLKFGGAQVDAHYYGSSHTGGDTIVYFPAQKFVMLSDTVPFASPTPGVGGANGSAVQVPGLLDRVLKLDFDTAIAGRGPLMTRAEIQAYKGKWDTFMTRVKDAIAKGATKETLATQVKQDDLGWMFNAGFFGNLYDELQKNPKGDPTP
jgi:glyoxylase-like metal-dependent hydrolase (beta-lactamase superfamily II)